MQVIKPQEQEAMQAAEYQKRFVNFEAVSRLDELVAKARALNHVTYGNHGEGLRESAPWIQDSLNWLLADLLQDIEQELDKVVIA